MEVQTEPSPFLVQWLLAPGQGQGTRPLLHHVQSSLSQEEETLQPVKLIEVITCLEGPFKKLFN